ncbi:hypothetical protein [Tenacibaculum mesophilum]|uniref:hypothetical protein n=1 Tax=Tenacibaculum mesophilum TaxID=104268 RepID=UPI000A9A343A|nr:hypothetical protein [Tenacibaculum mesophilum]
MLKSISSLGNVLNKSEQREVNGGQIVCPRGTYLKCNWIRCWCEPEYVEELPVDFDH